MPRHLSPGEDMKSFKAIHMDDAALQRIASILPGGAADQAQTEMLRRRAEGEDVHAFQVPSTQMIIVGPMPK